MKGGIDGGLLIPLQSEGYHILSIETTSAHSTLAAQEFADYVKEEGLTPIAQIRAANGQTDQDGREIYSRRGKALIQIGKNTDMPDAHVTAPIGLTLEIVPDTNPYTLSEGEAQTSTIYYRGEPIQGVTIGLISLDTDAGILALSETNSKGKVTFPRQGQGSYMLHAVWSDELEGNPEAEFDTIFSSLSFAFE